MPVFGCSMIALNWSAARIEHAHSWQTCIPHRYAHSASEQAQRWGTHSLSLSPSPILFQREVPCTCITDGHATHAGMATAQFSSCSAWWTHTRTSRSHWRPLSRTRSIWTTTRISPSAQTLSHLGSAPSAHSLHRRCLLSQSLAHDLPDLCISPYLGRFFSSDP